LRPRPTDDPARLLRRGRPAGRGRLPAGGAPAGGPQGSIARPAIAPGLGVVRRDIDTRFAVVGSGAGGSVVAWHLARHGEPTVVLERGKWVAPDDMTHDERAMIALLYKDAGAQTNTEADMFLLQGNCVVGSTVLTNAV